ncbi:ATP synthase F0 subunit C [Allokutzneria oryzae]|uniref:ATP synthase F(0) sector subunit c n=1 Tax=Allokutzneria oryzae TaxID=1378989 RepID=A0ABV6A568_9PSEU
MPVPVAGDQPFRASRLAGRARRHRAGVGVGIVAGKTVEAMARPPEMAGQLRTTVILGIAFSEALGLLGLVAGLMFGGIRTG